MTDRNALADLKPCPFCGEKPVTERTGFSGRAMYIYCNNADEGCPRPKAVGETVEKAIENWNTRAGQDSIDASPRAPREDVAVLLLQQRKFGNGAIEMSRRSNSSAWRQSLQDADAILALSPAPAAAPTLGPLDILEVAFCALEEKFKKLNPPPDGRIDTLQYCIGAIRDVRHDMQAVALTAPDKGGPDEKPSLTAKEAIEIGMKIADDYAIAFRHLLSLNGNDPEQALHGNAVWLAAQIMKAMQQAQRSVAETDPVLTICLEDREDGGVRVWSEQVPGLILSGKDRRAVSSDIIPAIDILRAHNRPTKDTTA